MNKLECKILAWRCLLDCHGSWYSVCKFFHVDLGKGNKRIKKKRAKQIAAGWVAQDLKAKSSHHGNY